MLRSYQLTAIVAVCISVAPFTAALADEQAKAIQLFNGRSLQGWLAKGGPAAATLQVGKATLSKGDPRQLAVSKPGDHLVNQKAHARDFYTQGRFGDGVYEIEFMVPKGSNSGVYLLGEYEVQILDSYGKEKVGPGDLGGLYGAQAPRVNASKAPGKWQKFVIDFRTAKFDDQGKKTANARFVKVTLNGVVIHENVEMKGVTPGGLTGRESATGPLMFQGNHGPVAYRNVMFRPAKD